MGLLENIPAAKMTGALVLLLLVSAACARDLRLESQWEAFKTTHGKQYTSLNEELTRRAIWEDNLQIIRNHNLAADRGEHTFWLGENEYADMSLEEFQSVMNGYLMDEHRRPN